jgi:hypothetical protein
MNFSEEAVIGDVVERIRDKIGTSRAVSGVLTGANPMVFLEVGNSWGIGRPTIAVVELAHDEGSTPPTMTVAKTR